jgi:hypothetical protein
VPSPIAAIDLLSRAGRKIGVLAVGETFSSDEANDWLAGLNDVLETWSIEGLTVYNTNVQTFATIAGQATYTIGTGGNFNAERPVDITAMYHTVHGVDFVINPWSLQQYDGVPIKSQRQEIVERYVYINDYPLAQIILWPTPSLAVPLYIDCSRLLSQVPSLSATINLPPAYARALQYATCVEMMSEYGDPVDVTAQARSTKAPIKRANRTPRISQFDSTLTSRGPVAPGWVV